MLFAFTEIWLVISSHLLMNVAKDKNAHAEQDFIVQISITMIIDKYIYIYIYYVHLSR